MQPPEPCRPLSAAVLLHPTDRLGICRISVNRWYVEEAFHESAWDDDVRAFDAVYDHILHMSDALADGIVQAVPEQVWDGSDVNNRKDERRISGPADTSRNITRHSADAEQRSSADPRRPGAWSALSIATSVNRCKQTCRSPPCKHYVVERAEALAVWRAAELVGVTRLKILPSGSLNHATFIGPAT